MQSERGGVFCLFVKFNPNACDVTPPVKLEDRVARVASRCSNFMNTPASEFSRMSEEGEANVPHVQCFYYHSKQGAGVLEHIKDHAADNWVWYGNDTGSSYIRVTMLFSNAQTSTAHPHIHHSHTSSLALDRARDTWHSRRGWRRGVCLKAAGLLVSRWSKECKALSGARPSVVDFARRTRGAV